MTQLLLCVDYIHNFFILNSDQMYVMKYIKTKQRFMFCIVYHHNAFQHPTIPEQSHALPLTHGLAIADAAAFCHSRLILPSSSLLDEIGVSLA